MHRHREFAFGVARRPVLAPLRRGVWLLAMCAASVVGAAPVPNSGATLASATAPPAPQLQLDVAPGTLTLRWPRVAGATYYRVLSAASASGPLRQLGPLLPGTARAKAIPISAHLQAWAQTRYVVAACNANGCTRSARIGAAGQLPNAVATLTSQYELHEPTNASRNQQFGGQVAVSADGRTLAVADLWYYGGSEWPWYGSGAVYVYQRGATGWALQAKLEPPEARGYDFFGSDVALSANGATLAVGAQYEGYDAPSQDEGPGSVYVFTRANGLWTRQATLRAPNAQDGASFGRSVEINAAGDVIAAGAPFESAADAATPTTASGAVYVFTRVGASWSAQATLRAPAPESNDLFGLGLRLSEDGRTLAALAAEQNAATEDVEAANWGSRFNTVYVFRRPDADWLLQVQFEGSAEEPMLGGSSYDPEGQIEGFDLSASGRTLALASPFARGADGETGLIRIYKRIGEMWLPSATITPALRERSSFGLRVALSNDGQVLAASAERNDGPYGRRYVASFVRNADRWRQTSAIEPSGWPNYTSFGNSLALSQTGQRLVVGARSYSTETTGWGAAFVY